MTEQNYLPEVQAIADYITALQAKNAAMREALKRAIHFLAKHSELFNAPPKIVDESIEVYKQMIAATTETGTYVGNGTSGRDITVGFEPGGVFIKEEA